MPLLNIKKTIQHLSRYREIIGVLLKYGFEDIIDQLNIDIFMRKLRAWPSKKEKIAHAHKSRPELVHLVFEELGPVFIKLGQMLSTRYDILPVEYTNELRKLQDKVKPFPVNESVRTIEHELNAGIDQLFAEFQREPIAAASIAQVHRVRLKSGQEGVVKVRRPEILQLIERDIPILKDLAQLLEKYIPDSRVFDPSGLVVQFQKWIREELNFLQEGRNVHRFRKNFMNDETIYVPEVYWDLTTERVLTLEYVEGIYIDQVEKLRNAGLDPVLIAERGTLFVLKQIFEYHFFHGDPHPSNLLILPGNVIAPLDFGLMGRLDEVLVSQIGDLLQGIIKNDIPLIVRSLIQLNRLKVDVDRDQLRIEVYDLLAHYNAVPLHMLNFEHFFNDLVGVIRNNQIQFPQTLYLMGKSQMIMEGIAQKLNPEYDLIEITRSYFTRTMISRAEAEKFLRNASALTDDLTDLAVVSPGILMQILNKARWGKLGINLHHQQINELMREMDRSANRLSFSMIIASLIIGSSLIIELNKAPRLWGMPLFGLIGYLLAGLLGLWLVVNILRSRNL